MKIGFIGLGIMGRRMAANLLKKGHELIVFNRTPEKTEQARNMGATVVNSAAEAGSRVDVLISMVSTPEVVYELALGEHGFLQTMKENSIWINTSTVNPSFARDMADRATELDIKFLDAPVTGSKEPAEKGELVFLLGGDERTVQKVHPLLQCMGSRIMHVGPAGHGSAMKILLNLLMGQSMAALAEALTLGEALDIPSDILYTTLLDSPVTSPILKDKIEKLKKGDFEPEFPLKWMHKDLHLATTTAYEHDVSLPMGSSAKEVFALARHYGLGEEDFSAVYKLLKGGAGAGG